jgi:hypothetical protein
VDGEFSDGGTPALCGPRSAWGGHDNNVCRDFGVSRKAGCGDALHLYEDAKLMGHVYSAPCALLEPTLVLVVVDGDEVAGFPARGGGCLSGAPASEPVARRAGEGCRIGAAEGVA